MSGDTVFHCQFYLIGEDHSHRPMLEDDQWALRGEAVGGELFALVGVDFRAEFGEQDSAAGSDEGEWQAGVVGGGIHGRNGSENGAQG